MNQAISGLLLVAALAGTLTEIAEARGGRAGGGRARANSGSFQRQGTRTGAQGNTSTHAGQGTWSRGNGSYARNYDGTRTGPNGQSQQVNRNQNVTKTGDNSYQRDGSHTVTGANGESRTRTTSGQGTVQKTDSGYTKSYDGTITTDKGKVINVDRSTEATRNADGTVSKDRSVEYTDSSGNALGTGQSNSVRTPGQGTTTTGSYTNAKNGNTSTYQGSTTPSGEGGYGHTSTWTGAQGNSRTTNANARWQYIDGKWVKSVQSTTAPVTPAP